MTDRSDRLRSSRYNPVNKQRDRVGNKEYGVYVGVVVSAADLAKTGKLVVRITGLTRDPEKNFTCRWSSPFAGITDLASTGDELTNFRQTQTTYGMWMIPPDPGNLVLVVFAEGNISEPYVIGCLYPDRYHHMVPGIPAGKSYGDQNMLTPVAEKNKRSQPNQHDGAFRPMHADLAQNITRQGLINDPIRGAGTSGSRRESPSEVFGILTPGALDERDAEFFSSRLAGHQLVMDDNKQNRMIRIRSGGGNQLLLNDVDNTIYMINSSGKCWLEFDAAGNMKYYAEAGISFRTNGNFNIRADKNINIEAGQNLNLKAAGDTLSDGTYVGGAATEAAGAAGLPAPGIGGSVNITAKQSIQALGDRNVAITAGGGDIDVNAANAVKVQASGAATPSGSAISLEASGAGGISMNTTSTLSMQAAGAINGTAPIINFGGGLILLNTGSPVPVVPQPAATAFRLNGAPRPDVSTQEPEFDIAAAVRGKPAIPNNGQRPVSVPKVYTIVTSMPTPEPYEAHAQYNPKQAGVSGQSESTTADIPDGAIRATRAANKLLPDSTQIGQGIQDGVAQFQNLSTMTNNFQTALSTSITGSLGSLQAHLTGIQSMIPPIRFPTSNALEEIILGVGTVIDQISAVRSQLALLASGALTALTDGAMSGLTGVLNEISEIAQTPDEFNQLLGESGITVSALGDPGGLLNTVYTDAAGNQIIDFSNGLSDQAALALDAASLESTWQDVSQSFPDLPVTGNQAIAIADFARDIGPEKFARSNVAETLRLASTLDDPAARADVLSNVGKQMQQWSLVAPRPGADLVFDPGTQARRQAQAQMFNTPEAANERFVEYASRFSPGEASPTEIATLLEASTDELMG